MNNLPSDRHRIVRLRWNATGYGKWYSACFEVGARSDGKPALVIDDTWKNLPGVLPCLGSGVAVQTGDVLIRI